MAVKYVVIPEKKMTIGILSDTEFDAINRIEKLMGNASLFLCNDQKYMMPHTFKATVVCHDGDEYSAEEGKRRAKQKLLKNYYRSLDKRLDKFREELLILNGKFFETPKEGA